MGTSVRGFEFGHLRWGFALVLGCFHWPWVHLHYSYGWCSWYSSPLRPFESCESYTRKTCSVSEDPSKEDLVSIRICCAKRCWYNSAWCHVGANEFVSRVSNGRTEMWMNCHDFFSSPDFISISHSLYRPCQRQSWQLRWAVHLQRSFSSRLITSAVLGWVELSTWEYPHGGVLKAFQDTLLHLFHSLVFAKHVHGS